MRRRFTPHVLAGLASAAVLAPIYLIALSALSAKSEVSAWPKAIWPRALSLETLSFFFGVRAVWTALGQSLIVAALTVAFATLLGAPAGYALARFRFAGKDTFRLLVLLTRAFPIAILTLPLAVRFIRLGL